jgi:hypothetical protein
MAAVASGGGAALAGSILTGQLPDMPSLSVPKLDYGKMRYPGPFCGVGETLPYSFPGISAIVPRVKGNVSYFSANYMATALVVAFCTA